MIQHTTHSGYLKMEVYKELETSMEEQHYEKVCYLTAELACTKGEIANLLDYLLGDLLCRYYLSSNAWVLHHTAETLKVIRILPKRDLHTNPGFQKALCEMALGIATHGKRASHDVAAQLKTVTYHDAVEPLLCQYQDGPIPAVESALQNKVSNELLKLLKLFFWLMLNKKSTQAMQVASFMLQSKEYFVDELVYKEIEEAIKKAHRKDVVWYIWKLLLIFTTAKKDLKPEVVTYVQSALAVYIYQFKKRVRQQRVNLLYFAIMVVCQRNAKVRVPSVYEPLAKDAVSQIGIVYRDLLVGDGDGDDDDNDNEKDDAEATDTYVDADANAHAYVHAPKSKNKEQPAVAAAATASVDYLMTVVERNDRMIETMKREREQMRRNKNNDIFTRVVQL